MSRSVETLNNGDEIVNNQPCGTAFSSSLTISSDTETARRRLLFSRYRGWSTLDEFKSDGERSLSNNPKITRRVSGYLRELVNYNNAVKVHNKSIFALYLKLSSRKVRLYQCSVIELWWI